MSTTDRMHELLPWHLNGTLAEAEAAAFEAHLEGCGSCRRELRALRELQATIREHGEAFFTDHPAAERLVALAAGELAAEEARVVRRHLALCATCAAEERWVRGEAAPSIRSAGEPARAIPFSRRPAGAWAAAASILLVAAILLLRTASTGGPGAGTRILDPVFLDSTARAADETVVPVPPGVAFFPIYIQVDAGPGDLPLLLTVRDAAGREVHRSLRLRPPFRGQYLFLHCDRREFPDGSYVVTVHPEGDESAPSAEYRFRVVQGEDGGW